METASFRICIQVAKFISIVDNYIYWSVILRHASFYSFICTQLNGYFQTINPNYDQSKGYSSVDI